MKIKAVNIFSILIFFYLMMGPHAWFLWFLEKPESGDLRILVSFIMAILCYVYCVMRGIKLKFHSQITVGFFLMFIAICIGNELSLKRIVYAVFYLFPLWVLLSDRRDYQVILHNIILWLAAILIPGIILHVFILKVGLLPGVPMMHPSSSVYMFVNYGVLLKGIDLYESDLIRFQSIFLEPGYLGTFLSFLLYTIRFDFKTYKAGWVLLVAMILSLSLAAYVLTFMEYLFCQWSQKRSFSLIFSAGLILAITYFIGKNYNDGDNYINTKILERLELNEEKGISGNNRVGDATDYYFERSLADGTFLWGMGSKRINKINGGKDWRDHLDYKRQIRGAGYKIFILYYGLIAAFFYMLGYYFIGVKNRNNRRYVWGYYIIILVTFIQAAYPNSYSWLIPFIMGTGMRKDSFDIPKIKKEYDICQQ